jgi:uncharacterized DUF497 family protein
MGLIFEWDEDKAEINRAKHAISFEEASTVFIDEFAGTIDDPLHSDDEERFITIGLSLDRRLLVIVHTDRDDRIRIISARLATKLERRAYEEDK